MRAVANLMRWKLVKITTDSCADLNEQLYKENNISVIPLFVTLGEDEYLDIFLKQHLKKEIVDINDIDNTALLIAEYLKRV